MAQPHLDVSSVEQVLLQKKRMAEARKRGSKKLKLKKNPRILDPKRVEREYQRALRKLVQRARDIINNRIISQLPTLVSLNDLLSTKLDSYRLDQTPEELLRDLIRSTQRELEIQLSESEIEAIAREYAGQADLHNKKQLSKVFASTLGVDLVADNPAIDKAIRGFIIQNTDFITNVNQEFLRETQRVITTGFRQGLRAEEISKQLIGTGKFQGQVSRFKKAKTRANLIARDQISKLNGKLNEERQKAVGINKFVWVTALDERVRTDHRLDGEIFNWNSPISKNGRVKPNGGLNPGEDINCRCYADPVFEDLLE
jgi:SPP1 gp7 family putative phage head morphogenesis protein